MSTVAAKRGILKTQPHTSLIAPPQDVVGGRVSICASGVSAQEWYFSAWMS